MIQSIIDARIPQPTATNQLLVWNNTTGLFEASVSLSGLTLNSPEITGTVNASTNLVTFGGAVLARSFDASGTIGLSFIFDTGNGGSGFVWSDFGSDELVQLQIEGDLIQDWDGGVSLSTIYSDLDVTGNITTGQFIGDTDDPSLIEIDGAGGIVTVGGDIQLENAETIRNDVDGVIRLAGVGGTYNNWIDFKLDVASSVADLDTSATNFRFLKSCIVGDDLSFGMGTGGDAFFRWKNYTNRDCLQIGTFVNDASSSGDSGYITIVDLLDKESANREPAAFSVDPVLRVYSADETEADDWIELFHNQTTGVLQCGNGGLVMPCNVRVGDTTPATEKLEVAGNAVVTGDVSGATLTAGDGFTGTGAYTNFTITNGIITAAS